MCTNKLKDWDASVKHCTEALKFDADNVKGLFRRATAYEATKAYGAALAPPRPGSLPCPLVVSLSLVLCVCVCLSFSLSRSLSLVLSLSLSLSLLSLSRSPSPSLRL